MALIQWNRNEMLPSLTFPNWIDSFFRDDDFYDNCWIGREMTIPAVNVNETGEAYHLEVAAPGMKKEDIKVEVKDGCLNISAETKSEQEEKGDNYTRREFNYQTFHRCFHLPKNVKSDHIEAHYTDGVLKIAVPKVKTETKKLAKQIAVS